MVAPSRSLIRRARFSIASHSLPAVVRYSWIALLRSPAYPVAPESFCDETTAIQPRRFFRRQNSSRLSYASPFVLAKGAVFGGSVRQRIRATSLVTSRFDRQRNPSRELKSSTPSTESLSLGNSPPRPTSPRYRVGFDPSRTLNRCL
jgi:hypothetical protein